MFKVILSAIIYGGKKHPLNGYAKALPKEWESNGGDHVHVSTPEGRTLEVSSGGIQANARSLAAIAGLLANGGKLPSSKNSKQTDSVRLVSEDSVTNAMGGLKRLRDDVWCMDISNTRGGFFDFGTMVEVAGLDTSEEATQQRGFVGWAGKGGSLFLWDAKRRIGFAYVMSGMMNGGNGGPRTEPFFKIMNQILI